MKQNCFIPGKLPLGLKRKDSRSFIRPHLYKIVKKYLNFFKYVVTAATAVGIHCFQIVYVQSVQFLKSKHLDMEYILV